MFLVNPIFYKLQDGSKLFLLRFELLLSSGQGKSSYGVRLLLRVSSFEQ